MTTPPPFTTNAQCTPPIFSTGNRTPQSKISTNLAEPSTFPQNKVAQTILSLSTTTYFVCYCRITALIPNFQQLSIEQQLLIIECPITSHCVCIY